MPTRWGRSLPPLAALLLWPLCGANAGDLPPVAPPSDLVSIEVQAIDRITNQPIQGLSCADFEVWEESLPAPIVDCDQGGAAPRDVLLVLDFSGGHGDEAVDYAAPALLGVLRPKDRVATMWFAGDEVHVAPRLTDDHKQARERLQDLVDSQPTSRKSFRRSSLYDALLSGAQFLSETPGVNRPLIVVVTHNREGKSVATDAQVVDALLRSSIRLEAVTVPQQGSKRGPFRGDWRNLPWETPHGVDVPSNLGPERPRTFLDDLFSVEPILAKVGGTAVRLDYESSRQIWDGKKRQYWGRDAVALAIKRELVERVRNPFVLTIRGSSTAAPELRRLEVRLTAETRRAHTSATVASPSGYYTRSAGSAP